MSNPQLGYWTCERGGKAEVYQTLKKGRHFYTKCSCCGLNQGTGTARQQAIFDEVELFAEVTIARPSGVVDKADPGAVVNDPPKVEHKPRQKPVPKVEPDFDPTLPADEPVAVEPEPEKKSSGVLLALSVFAAAVGVGVWMG